MVTHKDPDLDGISSMLALDKALLDAGKEVICFTEEPLSGYFSPLKGSERIVQHVDPGKPFDVALVLDCGALERAGAPAVCLEKSRTVVNIDHHETNQFFGDLNLVDAGSSSTGELVFELIETTDLPLGTEVAENIFAAIQADTGSFSYSNTTPGALRIAGKMLEYGVRPWELSRKVLYGCGMSRLRLLKMALGSIEFRCRGKVGMMMISLDMYHRAGAGRMDSERFVDYPRFVWGVEIAVLIRQVGEREYKFSLRSNGHVNVARLASLFGGGGHAKAAGFTRKGSLVTLKEEFLREAARSLDLNGKSN